MFEKYRKFKKIIVTGPQRSGTTITAKIIANDLNYQYIDETQFDVDNIEKFRKILSSDNIVLQCPGLVYYIDRMPSEALKLFIFRNVNDIILSQVRIGWTEKYEQYEKEKLKNNNLLYFNNLDIKYNPVSVLKYELLEFYRFNIDSENCQYLEYSELEKHPMFIKKELRKNFTPKQTS